MGTRSTIAIQKLDGSVEQIYCHWDGYLDHNGTILKTEYRMEHVLMSQLISKLMHREVYITVLVIALAFIAYKYIG